MARAMKKRIWSTLVVLFGLLLLPSIALAEEAAEEKNSIDTSNADNGYITVYYAQGNHAQFRVGIELGGSEQFHNYTGGSRSHIALPGSGGELTATLYEKVSGNSYKVIEKQTFRKTAVTDSNQVLLQSSNTLAPVLHAAGTEQGADPSEIIDVPMNSGSLGSGGSAAWSASRTVPPEYQKYLESHREISFTLGDAVSRKAAELVAGKSTTEAQVMAIYSYIIQNFSYDWDFYYAVKSGRITTHTPDPNTTLNKRKGVCYDIASLFAAMTRSVGIPTKMIKGNAVAAGGYHAWNSIYEFESLSWVDLDPTLNMGGKATSLYKPLTRGYSATSEL